MRISDWSSDVCSSDLSASSITRIPRSAAFLSFDPAPGPATTRSVLAETDPATRAPSASACAFASSRLSVSRLPVKTTIGGAQGRERVCPYEEIQEVAVTYKKKIKDGQTI